MNDSKLQQLQDAALFALGWVIAKEGSYNCAAAYFLALALKETGVDSMYITAVLKAHEGQKTEKAAKPGDGNNG